MRDISLSVRNTLILQIKIFVFTWSKFMIRLNNYSARLYIKFVLIKQKSFIRTELHFLLYIGVIMKCPLNVKLLKNFI